MLVNMTNKIEGLDKCEVRSINLVAILILATGPMKSNGQVSTRATKLQCVNPCRQLSREPKQESLLQGPYFRPKWHIFS